MPKNHNTHRDELVCGKLDVLALKMQLAGDHNAIDLINDIRHDCNRMEQKLISRKREARAYEALIDQSGGVHIIPPSWGSKSSLCGRAGLLAKNFQDITCEHCLAKSKEKPVPLKGPLRVIRAAVTDSKTGEVFSLVAPARHPHVMWYMNDLGLREHHGEQGFILSDGSFADRRRALAVAIAANQLLDFPVRCDILFSENVW